MTTTMTTAAETSQPNDVAAEFQRRREVLNDKWRVTLQFLNKVIGGTPAVGREGEDPVAERTILEVWIKQHLGDKLTEEELQTEVEKTMAEVYAEEEPKHTTTFKVDGMGLYIEGRCVKAMLKEEGKRLGLGVAVKGTRPSLKQDLHEALHVDEDAIYLMRDGKSVTQPDGYEVRPIHVTGPQGPRTSIKRAAYVERPTVTFTVRILNMVNLKEDHLKDILAAGQDLGIGADRSQNFGKFAVIGFEEVTVSE